MKIIKTAKTIEDAIKLALVELDTNIDNVDVELLQEPKSGFLGFGSRDAKVSVSLKKDTQDSKKNFEKNEDLDKKEDNAKEQKKEVLNDKEIFERLENAKSYLLDILKSCDVDANVDISSKDDFYLFDIKIEDDEKTGNIIGKRGDTLDSIQYLLNLSVNKDNKNERIRIFLDTADYRNRRKASLEKLAINMAQKARKYKKVQRLEPMNPYERRLVHFALQNEKDIETFSEGREPYRRVIIKSID